MKPVSVDWSPYFKRHINKLKRMQGVAIKIIFSIRELAYDERLERLKLSALKVRKERGALVMFKGVREMELVHRNIFLLRSDGKARG